MQQLNTSVVPESLGELSKWCKKRFTKHCSATTIWTIHFTVFAAFVLGYDIKQERQVNTVNLANIWFLLNAVRATETAWVAQLNRDATFALCRVDIDRTWLLFIR